MRRISDYLHESRLSRYIFTGGASYLIELSFLLFLTKVLHFTPAVGVACSFWVGLAISFLLQKHIAFQDKNNDKKSISKQVGLYGVLVAFNYAFTILFVSLLAKVLGLVIARTLALALTTIWNFLLYSKVIFKARP